MIHLENETHRRNFLTLAVNGHLTLDNLEIAYKLTRETPNAFGVYARSVSL